MLIDFIRHGEPLGGPRYRGNSIDDPLSREGWNQMWAAVSGARPWSRVVSSPLKRCLFFAKALAQQQDLPLAIDTRFREIGFGAREGTRPDELRAKSPDTFYGFMWDPISYRPEGAETLESLLARVGSAFDELVDNCPTDHILIIAHSGVIRAAIAHALGSDPLRLFRVRVSHAHFTRFEALPGIPVALVFHGRASLST